jgi:RNA polymerase sigma-B factor
MTIKKSAQHSEYQHLTPLFRQLVDPATAETERRRVRDTLVTEHLPVAAHIARRFAHRGQPVEDLEQVARVGLIYAVDRFDPFRGHEFLAFAVPTIIGEVRRYFRDLTWSITVPRSLQERHMAIAVAVDELGQELGASPRPGQIAERLDLTVEEVYEGLRAGLAYRCDPLTHTDSGGEWPEMERILPAEPDTELEMVVDRDILYRALAELPRREASIVMMRFYGNMTQTQIAQHMGISQMHVSRLLSQTLARLRGAFVDSTATPSTV